MGKGKKEPKTLECEEMNVIIRIPQAAASVTITAVLIGDDDKTVKVSRRLAAEDIRSARQDFLDNVEDSYNYDARYVITEEGMEYLRSLQAADT